MIPVFSLYGSGRRRTGDGSRLKRLVSTILALFFAIFISGASPLSPRTVHAACGFTLTVFPTTVATNGNATLRASYGCAVPTGYFIDIFEVGTQNDLVSCVETTPCSGEVSYPVPGTHSFVAYVDNDPNAENPEKGTIATSNQPSATWTGAPYTVSASASPSQPQFGQSTTVTAAPSQPLLANYHIDVYDESTFSWVGGCSTTPCSVTVGARTGTVTFDVYVDADPAASSDYPPANDAAETTLDVTWGEPSALCTAPTLPQLSGSVDGVSWFLRVEASGNTTMVCTREDGTGFPVGGELVVTSHQLSTPTVDTNGGLCKTTAGNQLTELRHPIASGGVGSTNVAIDVYQNDTQVWLCTYDPNDPTDPANTLNRRVVIPIAEGTPSVAFTPDS